MLLKMDLRVEMDAKSGQLKNEIKSKLFRAPGHTKESANLRKINAFEKHLIIQFWVHLITSASVFPPDNQCFTDLVFPTVKFLFSLI